MSLINGNCVYLQVNLNYGYASTKFRGLSDSCFSGNNRKEECPEWADVNLPRCRYCCPLSVPRASSTASPPPSRTASAEFQSTLNMFYKGPRESWSWAMFGFLYSWFLVLIGLWISRIKTQALPNSRIPDTSVYIAHEVFLSPMPLSRVDGVDVAKETERN